MIGYPSVVHPTWTMVDEQPKANDLAHLDTGAFQVERR